MMGSCRCGIKRRKGRGGEGRDDVRCSDGDVRDRVVGLVNKRGVDAVVVVMTAMGAKMVVKTREVSRA